MPNGKFYLTAVLFKNASELASRAREANAQGRVEKEIRLSIDAHLMAALCLEAAINEFGEKRLEKRLWESTDKLDLTAKWAIISRLASGAQFDPGREPLQTVADLQKVRNRIAHPKGMQQESNVILRHKDGALEHNVSLESPVAGGDTVYVGYGKPLYKFNAKAANQFVNRTRKALQQLKDATSYEGLEWLEGKLDYDFWSGVPGGRRKRLGKRAWSTRRMAAYLRPFSKYSPSLLRLRHRQAVTASR